jgi:hypothetical protein
MPPAGIAGLRVGQRVERLAQVGLELDDHLASSLSHPGVAPACQERDADLPPGILPLDDLAGPLQVGQGRDQGVGLDPQGRRQSGTPRRRPVADPRQGSEDLPIFQRFRPPEFLSPLNCTVYSQ